MMFTLIPTAMAEGEKVAKVGETEYDTLAAAINAAGTGGTVKLLADITGQTVIPAEKDIVLDLNGKTMTHTGTTLYNSGKLTVRDSSDDKSGKIVSTGNVGIGVNHNSTTTIEYANIEAVEGAVITGYATGAKITIEDGIFEASDNAVIAGNGNSTDHSGAARVNANTIIINGGKFTGNIKTTGYIACGIYAPWKDIVTVNGGEFTVNNGIGIVARAGQVKVNGGTFTCTGSAEGKVGDKNFDMAAAQCLYFDATDPAYPAYNSETDYIKVTGGTFSSNVSAYVADGYIQNENGTVETLGETNAVAKVGDTYYKTLAEAVAAAKNGETVTLLKNAEMTETIRITDGKKITLALDGHDVVIKTTGKFFLVRNGELTVTGTGMIKEETPYFAPIIIKGGAEKSENYSVVNVEEGVILEGWAGVMIDQTINTTNNYGMVLNVNGATLKGVKDTDNAEGLGVYVNGVVADAKVTLNNATLTADGYGMYLAGNADTTITGGTVSGTTTGIEIRAGKLTLDNCDVTGGSGEVTKNANGNGSTVNNAALAISQHTTKKDIDVTINGGTYTGTAAVYQTDVQGTGSENVKVNVNNGKFNGTVVGETANKLSITGGYFTSDPTAYLAASHYVWASDKDGYTYMVKNTAPTSADQKITVVDKTDTAVSSDITGNDEDAINGVISKANVDGVAEAVAPAKKADIVAKSSATVAENDKVEIEVAVKVEAKAADLANGKLTFEASPVATVKVNGTATGTTVPVTNDMLNGNAITVKLPLPAGFTPKQILHKFTGGGYEYFINETEGSKRGAGSFKIEDNCAVFTIYGFSTFELSGTVTYVAPSYSSGSSSDPTYSVTVDKTENGSVTVSPKSASKGDTVTVTVKPDSGYVLETLTVTDKNGNELTLKDKGDGKYTFTMPAGKVEVKATFMEDNSMLNFFYDVPNGAYFYEAVKWAVDKGITNGLSDTMFGPYESCTRAQIVTFLWRAAGSPEPKTVSSFTDVPASAYYAKAVAWAVENGITNGMTETTFAPDATCTRGQSVTFLHRALKGTASGSANFTDVKPDAFYADAVSWAVKNDVTNGTSNTTFSPNADCTRAEIVTFLYRAYQGK